MKQRRARLLTLCAASCLLLLCATASASPYPLEEILEKTAAEALHKAGINTSNELLAKGASAKELRALAKTTALPLKQLRTWTKLCDLVRVKGVGPEMVRLLNAGGITTIKQLRASRADRLHKRLMAANKKSKITEKPPVVEQVAGWIEQAKKLEIILR